MSFSLVVWDGQRPQSDSEAMAWYEDLVEREETETDPLPPTAAISAFVVALGQRHPQLTEDSADDSPWASGPEIGAASGDVLHLDIVWSRAAETAQSVAELAARHGLVCFDPQDEVLLPRTGQRPQSWFRSLRLRR